MHVLWRDAIIRSMKRFDRVNLVVLTTALVCWLLAGAFIWVRWTGPYDGARVQPGDITAWRPNGFAISPVDPSQSGLDQGDVVVAVDGRSLESWAEALVDPSSPRPAWQIGETVTLTVERNGRTFDVPVILTGYPVLTVLFREWPPFVFALVFQLLGLFVFLKRPAERAAQVLFVAGASIVGATTWSFSFQVGDIIGGIEFWLYLATTVGAYMLLWISILHFALVFPQPHSVLKRRRILAFAYAAPYVFLIVGVLVVRWSTGRMLSSLASVGSLVTAAEMLYLVLALAIGFQGFRARRDPVSRQQVRWFSLAVFFVGAITVLLGMFPELLLGYPLLEWNWIALFGLLIPLSLVVAILRYRLFDIDVLINRTVVYGTLTGAVILIYVLVVGYLGAIVRPAAEGAARVDILLSLVAAGLVAVVFQPLRLLLQRQVNRVMYGERDDPYAVLTRLGHRLETTLEPNAVLPTIVEAVAQALKLPHVAIALNDESGVSLAATYGLAKAEPVVLPLNYQSEQVGRLILSPRAPGEAFSPSETALLQDLARQAGVAAHAVRLTMDLRHSRERIVSAREEERRRLRRDLHDGLGPGLAALTLKIDAAQNLLTNDPRAAANLLAELKTQTQAAIADVRRMSRDLRPPALDELGLIAAIEHQAAQYNRPGDGLCVRVIGPAEGVPPLPAATEVAAYRITLEALLNVVRHAHARLCTIRISINGAVDLEVVDDGVGILPDAPSGVGTMSMHERAAELGGICEITPVPGGGTRVHARLPMGPSPGKGTE